MQEPFNPTNAVPMCDWLLQNRDDYPTYEDRMKLLGNVVVPQCGALAGDILLRLHRFCLPSP